MISKSKLLMIAALLLVLLPMNALAADPWLSGETHFYWRVGLTGGGTALDAISGLSMCPTDGSAAISGNSIYFYTVSVTGNASGTTTESSPDWIMPNTAYAGQSLAGVSMWKLLGVTGVTGVFKTLVLDNRTVIGSTVDLWNTVASGATQAAQPVLNQANAMIGVSNTYLTSFTAPGSNPTFGILTADKVLAGVSTIDTGSGLTLTGTQMAGCMIQTWASTPIVIGIPAISGASGFFSVTDMTGSGVTVQTTSGEVLYGTSGTGTAYFINAGNSRDSATFFVGSFLGGTSKFVRVIGEQGTWNVK